MGVCQLVTLYTLRAVLEISLDSSRKGVVRENLTAHNGHASTTRQASLETLARASSRRELRGMVDAIGCDIDSTMEPRDFIRDVA